MAIQVTIVGLGQIGTSIGLALREHIDILFRVGHDRDNGIARLAEKKGALDKVNFNLPSAVRQADLVLLCLPIDQIRATLMLIAPDLKPSAVVMDTAPIKAAVVKWAADLLPAERYYIGLTPVLNPAYLHDFETGLQAAHADLFKDGLLAIASPPRVPSEAIKLAADLTRLLGATPLFVDPLEIDGLMAAAHILPELISAALLGATIDQPGWREGRKVAGRAYAGVSGPINFSTEPQTLRELALLDRENVLRLLDGTVACLRAIREEIYTQDAKALDERLAKARRGREEWWKQRLAADWAGEGAPPVETPSAGEYFGRLIGLGRKK